MQLADDSGVQIAGFFVKFLPHLTKKGIEVGFFSKFFLDTLVNGLTIAIIYWLERHNSHLLAKTFSLLGDRYNV